MTSARPSTRRPPATESLARMAAMTHSASQSAAARMSTARLASMRQNRQDDDDDDDDDASSESVSEMDEMNGEDVGVGHVDTSVTAQKLHVMYVIPRAPRTTSSSQEREKTDREEESRRSSSPRLGDRTAGNGGESSYASASAPTLTDAAAHAHATKKELGAQEAVCDRGDAVCREGRVVTASLLALIEILADYDAMLAHFPSLAFDIIRRQCELLEQFDAEVAQLVLGASAVGRGTLRSITTVHLCMVAQCLGFIADMVPPFRSRLHHLFCAEAAPPTSRIDGGSGKRMNNDNGNRSTTSSAAANLRPFIDESLSRVQYNTRAHRRDCFRKIAALVESKVDSLGVTESAAPPTASSSSSSSPSPFWPARGNEWVMTMLREVARLLRTLRPLMPATEVDAVVGPLLTRLAGRIRRWTQTIHQSGSETHRAALADVRLFTANVEKFGYDVRRGVALTTPGVHASGGGVRASSTAVRGAGAENEDYNGEEEVLRWFFPRLPASSVYAGSERSLGASRSPSPTGEGGGSPTHARSLSPPSTGSREKQIES